jgi:hypothetical protein
MARFQIRTTVRFRNLDGLKARRRARTPRQKAAILTAQVANAEDDFNVAQALCNFRTGYMASKMRLAFTRGGYNYFLGFDAADFVGKVNTLADPPIAIKFFYPLVVVEGSVNYAGNDFFAAADYLNRARKVARIRAAVRAG